MRLNALNAGQNFELTSQRRKRKDAPEFIRGWRGRGHPHGKSRQTIDRKRDQRGGEARLPAVRPGNGSGL